MYDQQFIRWANSINLIIHSILRIKGGARERRRKIRQLILSCRILSGADFAPTPWCRWPDSNRHALRHLILSHLLHTEYRRTRPPAEVVDGHQKALPILLFLKMMCKKLRFVCHFRSFQFGREFWILEGHRRDVTHKQSTTAHAVDSSITNTL